jgi:isopenicillin-N N-acyltransferase-like protein
MKQFPVVKVSGTNYEVGVVVGKSLQPVIQKILVQNKKLFEKNFLEYLKESAVFIEQAKKYFPQYVEEVRGISDGAAVSFEELFLSNNREVADFDPGVIDPNHCTIIGIPTAEGYLLGHNEDWDANSLEHMYILDAVINGVKIFGLNYANNLIGDSVAINGYGLIEAVNELSHQDTQIGVPKNFIARAILDCKTLEETEDLMRTVPRAAGYNHVLVQGKRLWNIESSAKEFAIEKVDHQKYVHTNHYLTELKRIDTEKSEETKHRYNKVKGLLNQINSIEDVKQTLSDRNEPRICREETIGSVIFDTVNKTAHIAYGQPTQQSYFQIQFKQNEIPSDA